MLNLPLGCLPPTHSPSGNISIGLLVPSAVYCWSLERNDRRKTNIIIITSHSLSLSLSKRISNDHKLYSQWLWFPNPTSPLITIQGIVQVTLTTPSSLYQVFQSQASDMCIQTYPRKLPTKRANTDPQHIINTIILQTGRERDNDTYIFK